MRNRFVLAAGLMIFLFGCSDLRNRPEIIDGNTAINDPLPKDPDNKELAPKRKLSRRKPICLAKIEFYKDQEFSVLVSESSATVKVKELAKFMLEENLKLAGFRLNNCVTPKRGQLYLEVAVYHKAEALGLKHSIVSRTRAYDRLTNDRLENWLLEIWAEADIKGKDEESIRETARELAIKITKVIAIKFKPR